MASIAPLGVLLTFMRFQHFIALSTPSWSPTFFFSSVPSILPITVAQIMIYDCCHLFVEKSMITHNLKTLALLISKYYYSFLLYYLLISNPITSIIVNLDDI